MRTVTALLATSFLALLPAVTWCTSSSLYTDLRSFSGDAVVHSDGRTAELTQFEQPFGFHARLYGLIDTTPEDITIQFTFDFNPDFFWGEFKAYLYDPLTSSFIAPYMVGAGSQAIEVVEWDISGAAFLGKPIGLMFESVPRTFVGDVKKTSQVGGGIEASDINLTDFTQDLPDFPPYYFSVRADGRSAQMEFIPIDQRFYGSIDTTPWDRTIEFTYAFSPDLDPDLFGAYLYDPSSGWGAPIAPYELWVSAAQGGRVTWDISDASFLGKPVGLMFILVCPVWQQSQYWSSVFISDVEKTPPLQSSVLSETFSSESSLVETVVTEQALLQDFVVTGDFNSTLDFTDFEIVTIATGPFAGKGFSKGRCGTSLDGVSYEGDWRGVVFLRPEERKIYLRGAVTREILATVEGYLTESVPESGIYDLYQATWRIGGLGTAITSATVNVNGDISYQSTSEFPGTELHVLQTNIDGMLGGDPGGPLSTVISHVRIAEEANPYYGEGFSIISYVSDNGVGQGWTYGELTSAGVVELQGMFSSPLFGILFGTLDEAELPRTLSLAVGRVDLGLPPAPELKVATWGPSRVSPGQTFSYIIEYRNDGLKAAEDVDVIIRLPSEVKFVLLTGGGTYEQVPHEAIWDLGDVPPSGSRRLTVEVTVLWGLPSGTFFEVIVNIPREKIEIPVDATVYISYDILERTESQVKIIAGLSCEQGTEHMDMEASVTHVAEKTDPILEYSEDAEEITITFQFTVEGGSWDQVYTTLKTTKKGIDIAKTGKEANDLYRSAQETQALLDHLRKKDYMSQSDYERYTLSNEALPTSKAFMPKLLSRFPLFGGLYSAASRALLNAIDLNSVIGRASLNNAIVLQTGGKVTLDMAVKGYLDATSHDLDNHEHETNDAHDPNIKYGPEGHVSAGERLDYRVEYENEGEGIAFGVYFTDTLDEDLDDSTLDVGSVMSVSDGSVIAPPGTYDPQTRTITWFVGEVGPHEGGYADLSVNVRSDAPEGTVIINFGIVYFPSVPEVTRTNGIISIVPYPEGAVTALGKTGNSLTIEWKPFAGGQYTVQTTTDLASGVWTDAPGEWPTEARWCALAVTEAKTMFIRVQAAGQ